MAEDPRRAAVPHHIAAIAARTEGDARRLAQTLAGRCWPRGGDRSEPIAARWLQKWGRPTPPSPTSPGASALPACACTTGACAVCN
jgi:hypothetical protein